jgi:hypothetical protein
MASTQEVAQLTDERCPDCGSGFANDLKGTGFRRHLVSLPKRDRRTGKVLKDAQGKRIMCGGTKQSWGKGHRS